MNTNERLNDYTRSCVNNAFARIEAHLMCEGASRVTHTGTIVARVDNVCDVVITHTYACIDGTPRVYVTEYDEDGGCMYEMRA